MLFRSLIFSGRRTGLNPVTRQHAVSFDETPGGDAAIERTVDDAVRSTYANVDSDDDDADGSCFVVCLAAC